VYEYDKNKKESTGNRERLGAEFPFTRYFENFNSAEEADSLSARYADSLNVLKRQDMPNSNIESIICILESQINILRRYEKALITQTVTKGLDPNASIKDSNIVWIGEMPSHWSVNKMKYIARLKGRIGWQGLTSDEYTDEGAYLITGTDFDGGRINWESCVHVPMKRWEEARDVQIENGDLLITKDGTVGKVAIVDELDGAASLNSGVLRISTFKGFDRRYLFWVLQSDVFWKWFTYKNAGNSTIIHLYQNAFAEFIYPIPPIEEQQAIAKFLDERCLK
jgi:type I restriction enzyme S subunit